MKRTNLAAKICSLVLALAMALCCLPAAFATEDEITVSFSFYDGAIVIPKTELTVTDGTAEKYGYTLSENDHNGNPVNGITVFDAIVAAHEAYYGEAFTADTCGDYLAATNGFLSKAFGKQTSALGFCVNDKVPNDGIYVDAYGAYTGYAADTAVISGGDYISVYTYQDSYYADYYVTLDKTEVAAKTDEEFTLSASGLAIMYYGLSKPEVVDAMTNPMAGLTVYSTKDFKAYSSLGVLDAEGKITLSFSEPGEYWLCTSGDFDDPTLGTVPTVANWCKVTVTEPQPEPDPDPQPNPDPEPQPEPDAKDAFYLPKKIKASLNANPDEGSIVLTITVNFADIKGEAPEKSEALTLSLNITWFSRIIEFIAGIVK